MSSMLAAIKARKNKGQALESDHQDMGHTSQHADDRQKDLHGFVASLSDDEKGKLKHILSKDSSQAQSIQKGEPSSEEQGKIEQAMDEENMENTLQNAQARHDLPTDQSDDIQKSMLDSRYMGESLPDHKPRNLGERAKMSAAKKLKAKGKI